MAANRGFVLALGLLVSWTSAHAESRQDRGRHHAKKKKTRRAKEAPTPIEEAPIVIAEEPAPEPALAPAKEKEVAIELGEDSALPSEPPPPPQDTPKVVAAAPAPAAAGWQLELGPYIWASDVNANVAFAGLSTGTSLSFVQFVQHARFGIEAEGELRHGRFSVTSDLMYGSAEFSTDPMLGPLMATLVGNASSLLVDGIAGYQVLGDENAMFSLEGRAGIRYQSTAVSGGLSVAGFMISSPEMHDSGSDEIVGARAVFRPTSWLHVIGAADVGVAGASNKTWSAAADASVRISSGVRVTAGWRTLSMERSAVTIEMTGPRAAVQIAF